MMTWKGKEKRRFPRANFSCRIKIGSQDKILISHTENIGEGGVKVVLEEKLDRFSIVEIVLTFSKEKQVKCKGKIMWVVDVINPLDGKSFLYDTGIQFIEISEEDRQYIRELVEKLISTG